MARALRRAGVDAEFRPDLPLVSGKAWLRAVRKTDAVIHLEYDEQDAYSARQLAIAAALGRPVVRIWVGTDVLLCIQNRALREKAALIESVATACIAWAPHLIEELNTVGLTARFIPTPLDSEVVAKPVMASDVPRSVLVYLPTHRLEFYGAWAVRELAPRNPDLQFIVVGDESHHLAAIPNVTSLGWVSDMESLYRDTGCILRMTQHEGLPRIVVEALFRGRYAIHSWRLDGCWFAKTADEAHEKLKLFRDVKGPNVEGAAAVARLYQPAPETQYLELLRTRAGRPWIGYRISGFSLAVRLTVEARLKRLAKKVSAVDRRLTAPATRR
jgi:hypothetical protein